MRPTFEQMFLDVCEVISKRSTCKRRQVGAILVKENYRQIVSMGYNGPARGISHEICTNESGNCGCLHAEANCLLPGRPPGNYLLFCTHFPCANCIKQIMNCDDIVMVCYRREYTTIVSDVYNKEALERVGIAVRQQVINDPRQDVMPQSI